MSVVPIEKKLTESQLDDLASASNIDPFALRAFCEVEGGGIGFSDVTGRIIIRLEKTHFQHNHPGSERSGVWQNEITNQTTAWAAFLDAANIDKQAAMLSTSIGILQVMCENHKACNFNSPEEMWTFNEISEANQVETGIRFILADPILYKALKNKNWSIVAERYNGKAFRELAVRTNSIPYDRRMANAYIRFSNQLPLHRTTTTVNLRSGNGTQYPVISILRVNTAVTVSGGTSDWKNVKVIATGIEGWCSAKFIQ